MTFSDARRAAKFRGGDRRAFQEVYEIYAPRVMGYLFRLTGDRSDAEDLLQEVFVAAHQCRESYRGQSRMINWLLGIAARRWRDRRRGRQPDITGLDTEEIEALGEPRPASTVEESVIASITLEAALTLLAPSYREALLLVAGEGLTYAEAAAVTGEPIGTVKWRVSVAVRTMRRHLTDTAVPAGEGASESAPPRNAITKEERHGQPLHHR